MKNVVLKSITLRNFRGEKERTTDFNDVETTIMGDNGLGKSRHFDAFVWLLFGKDTKDRKDFNIKTLVDGKPLEKVNTEVSCLLDVDGETINLRRVYAEKWVKPRGQVEERFDGHEHELYWNDVPLKVGEYQTRINSIINDSVFKMITNPLFFANMKWQDQREQLFQLAGTITDHEIAAQKPEYAALMDKITGKSLVDFKREISARKKKLKDELDTIQPRIDQTHKLMPEKVDFTALEVEIESLENQIKNIDEAIADKTKAIRQQYESVQAKQGEINKLKQKRQQVLHEAQTAAKEYNESNTLDSSEKEFSGVPASEQVDNDSEQEKEKSSAKKEKIDFAAVVELYHKNCLSFPRIIKLSDARKQKVKSRLIEMKNDLNLLETVFKAMENSKFLRGENRNGWQATFDWVFENEKNWLKIIEGNYNDKTPSGGDSKNVNDIWDNQ